MVPSRRAGGYARRVKRLWCLLAVVVIGLTGCGIPKDPDGTLEAARQRGELIVGASHTDPVLIVDGEAVSGPEAELIEAFAAGESMTVRWVPGGEEKLVRMLEHGDIDVMVGGLTDTSPWSDKVGLTRSWAEDVDEYGDPIKRVVAVPLGENALIAALERFFDEEAGR